MPPTAGSAINGMSLTAIAAVVAAGLAFLINGLADSKRLKKILPSPGARDALQSIASVVVFGIMFVVALKVL